ncbi:Hypothetical protein SMAX5B_019396 [Scophthalmus maximus]|uniref:Uncharacterized protein n=1 Tax=Scophthalmus maximus TaxID=52904 RepID=A0A2U9B7Q7_SCOMX|nr:Hypothetical protein SMAX5B_019396 [Scophthalmus maximus]
MFSAVGPMPKLPEPIEMAWIIDYLQGQTRTSDGAASRTRDRHGTVLYRFPCVGRTTCKRKITTKKQEKKKDDSTVDCVHRRYQRQKRAKCDTSLTPSMPLRMNRVAPLAIERDKQGAKLNTTGDLSSQWP